MNLDSEVKKNKKITTAICPWYNKSEFEEVYKGLFSKNIFDMKWAVDRITVWESRCHPTLDIGIDATSFIIRAVIQDELYKSNTSLCQPPDLRSLYSLALIRFTNVVSEIARPYQWNTSVRKSASGMGIPEWIVDLRHNATHLRVPSLEQLRHGAAFALNYLHQNYWEKEINAFSDFCLLREVNDLRVQEAIAGFQNRQFTLLVDTDISHFARSTAEMEKRAYLKEIRSFIKSKPKVVLDTILKPGFFLPSAQDLEHLLSEEDVSFVDNVTIDLPLILREFWFPIIKILVKKNLIEEFIQLLLKILGTKDPMHKKIAACWIMALIRDDKDGILMKIPVDSRPSYNWLRFLGPCLDSCCTYTPPLLFTIMSKIDPPLPEEKRNFILALVAVYLGAISPRDEKPSNNSSAMVMQKIFSVSQIKDDLKLREKKEARKETIWHEPPEDIDWSEVPLGFVFGEQAEFTDNIPPVVNLEEKESVAKVDEVEEANCPETLAIQEEMDVTTQEEKENFVFCFQKNAINLYPSASHHVLKRVPV